MSEYTVTDLNVSSPSGDSFMDVVTPDGYHWYRAICRVNGEKYSIMAIISDELVKDDKSFIERYFTEHAIEEYKEDHGDE